MIVVVNCREILELRMTMQDNKQWLAPLREEGGAEEGIETFRPTDVRNAWAVYVHIEYALQCTSKPPYNRQTNIPTTDKLRKRPTSLQRSKG